jgi:hypothetical protein
MHVELAVSVTGPAHDATGAACTQRVGGDAQRLGLGWPVREGWAAMPAPVTGVARVTR